MGRWGLRSYQGRIAIMRRWLKRIAKVDVYELVGTAIIKHQGWFRQEAIKLPQILSWRVDHEMGVDIVTLNVGSDGEVTWLDWDNDLLAILHSQCADRQLS